MLNYRLMPIALTLFDGGADGGADGNGNGQSIGNSANGDYGNVVFGKQEAAAEVPSEVTKTPEERQAEFDAYIEQNKDLYDSKFTKEFDSKFNRRFREHKQLEANFNKADEVMSILAQRYGVNNIDDIRSAVENDDRLLEAQADEEGLTVDQMREIQSLRARADAEKRRADMFARQQNADYQYQQWVLEAEPLKDIYPDFDINAECENPNFMRLLKSGVPVQHAYEVVHINEIKQNNAVNVAKQTSKATADNIRARGNRPKENAGSATPGVVYKSDVSKLTPKDRAEIAKRVARGETISF